jgi:hypothetical protein
MVAAPEQPQYWQQPHPPPEPTKPSELLLVVQPGDDINLARRSLSPEEASQGVTGVVVHMKAPAQEQKQQAASGGRADSSGEGNSSSAAAGSGSSAPPAARGAS